MTVLCDAVFRDILGICKFAYHQPEMDRYSDISQRPVSGHVKGPYRHRADLRYGFDWHFYASTPVESAAHDQSGGVFDAVRLPVCDVSRWNSHCAALVVRVRNVDRYTGFLFLDRSSVSDV